MASLREPQRYGERADPVQHAWTTVPRERFLRVWNDLPNLLVLSSLHGWGASECLTQCVQHLELARPPLSVRWCHCPTTLASFELETADDDAAPDRHHVVVLDGVIAAESDPLWEVVIDLIRRHPTVRVIVTSIDNAPDAVFRAGFAVQELTEHDLSLDEDELHAIARANGVELSTEQARHLLAVTRGCLSLARRQLERLRSNPEEGGGRWFNLSRSPGLSYLLEVERAHGIAEDPSRLLGLLDQAGAYRRFSARMLHEEGKPTPELRYFHRIQALPLGHAAAEPSTELDVFEWDQEVWGHFQSRLTIGQRRRRLQTALDRYRDHGQVDMQLYCLLELGETGPADALVDTHLRQLMVALPGVVAARLSTETPTSIGDHPHLLLLAGALLIRKGGHHLAAGRGFLRAARMLMKARPTPHDPGDAVRLLSRRAYLAATIGLRDEAQQSVKDLGELLDDDAENGLIARIAADPEAASRIAGDLYPAVWAASQIDDHRRMMVFAGLMEEFANPASPTHSAETHTTRLVSMLLGIDVPAGPGTSGTAPAGPMSMLEAGREAEAADIARTLERRLPDGYSWSTPEGYLLLVQALVNPREVPPPDVRRRVAMSARFWDDGRPSAFILSTAVVALLANDMLDCDVLAMLDDAPSDWSVETARTLVALAKGDLVAADEALRRAEGSWLAPRPAAVTSVLRILVYLRSGNEPGAAQYLGAAVGAHPRRLLRFALRFLPVEDFDRLRESVAEMPEIVELLAEAAADLRPYRLGVQFKLSDTEREVLEYLRAGHTNRQIAELRFVALSTIRTQVRLLLRKLGVANRREAVRRAEALGLFDNRQAGR